MTYIRTLALLIAAGVLSLLLSNGLSVGKFDILILAFAVAPYALLRTYQANSERFRNPQSIIFTKYNSLFRLLSVALTLGLFFGLYKYAVVYGLWKTVAVFIFSSLSGGLLYGSLKWWMLGEVFLYPIELLAIILFFFYSIK